MKRPKRSPKRRNASPYPHRGSPAGDTIVGTCDGEGCARELQRGDIFFINAVNQLFCIDCREKLPGVDAAMHRRASREQEAVFIEAGVGGVEVPDLVIWDGEFPF